MQLKSVLFLSLMATLGSVAAVDWKCPAVKSDKYCGARKGAACYLVELAKGQIDGQCASTEPDHKCCDTTKLSFHFDVVPCNQFKDDCTDPI
ncbi:hypothetical protein MJO28_009480 [Puccinia striiformis f. sp. tritici]|uniref:Uncharacterized protein n=2 Tax=Puccinia striiformis TaxID=27350 RepID=A0A2S4WJ49_9BASI|nr:hypothetical protein Pst134EB_018547 [Puccinia striiformis f. sp. tritici]KAI7947572.1 hypothetical protein MJO28_009480 [Puccinia striiformis f. sp. tritici]KAI7950598.1 hypothetical protein MJO29_009272 [Puccinia striiformis f. sp. tritici]KAI9607178.1 hypothetical protein H4Q26_005693 [Puccinia striiformis f. sp. tritici PST-130]POW21820.1 hypothetical protein PSHT_01953 [Puccinia striiformis]